ncbi:MAG TPA: SDR family oxidoreductase, partial [Stenotrophobium sp.]|nr:SDR family oxidoreductase [Stenotrophobium sp.]
LTGAAGNLGKAVAAAFEAAGWSLALLDVNDSFLRAAYTGATDRKLLLTADLMNPASVATAVESTLKRYGRIDALCNIAGGFAMGPSVHATTVADWQKMQELNVGTLLNIVRLVTPKMLAQGGGKIVNIGSLAGLKASAQMGAYSVAKGAVIRITEAMAAELRDNNINVNCVLPSVIDTPQNRAAMPDADPSRWVAPADLAAVIVFLCSDAARAIHGAAIPVSGLS